MKYDRTSRLARLACWAAVAVTAACWIPANARAAASLSPIGDVVAAKKDKDKEKDKAMNNDQKRKLSRAAFDITPLSKAAIDKLAEKLSPEDAKVILRKGTEAPFCGNLLDNKKEGTYICKLCNLPLFASNSKFDSGTGWPSFFAPFAPDHIKYVKDKAHGMDRNEILCARCDAHLGHVFEDGPAPTGLRYCLNSASMDFVEKGKDLPYKAAVEVTETAYFAGGCFWGTEDHFQQIPGVINAVSGYQGGKVKNPTYKQVCSGDTGHTETVMVVFDPKAVEYTKLLDWFFKLHDPTTMNRQGPDVGSQYRSAIFTSTDKQFDEAKAFLATNSTWRGKKVVTELKKVSDAGRFYDAELYHQDYHEKNGGSCPLPAAEVKETIKAPVK